MRGNTKSNRNLVLVPIRKRVRKKITTEWRSRTRWIVQLEPILKFTRGRIHNVAGVLSHPFVNRDGDWRQRRIICDSGSSREHDTSKERLSIRDVAVGIIGRQIGIR